MRNVYKTIGRAPLGKSRNRWENSIKMDFKEIWCEDVNWIQLILGKFQWLNP
jgi:hypothetical protein